MNKYEELSVEVIEFNAEDIVTASKDPDELICVPVGSI